MLSWETLIGLARSSGDSASAASSTLREAQPEYRMCVRASWAVICIYFISHARRCETLRCTSNESGPGGSTKVGTVNGGGQLTPSTSRPKTSADQVGGT